MNRVTHDSVYSRRTMSRRTFIAGAAGLATIPAFAQAAPTEAFVAPDGEGDGVSLQQPAAFGRLGELIKTVGPGGTVYILADRGEYRDWSTPEIAAGGSATAPVRIIGVDAGLQPARAVIVGNREHWTRPADESGAVNAAEFGGNVALAFASGSSHLHFSSLSFVDIGRVFDFNGRKESGITIEDVDFLNVRDGFFTDEASELTDVNLLRFSGIGFSKKAIRMHGNSHGWTIIDCEFDSGWQFGDSFAVGIELNHTAHDVLIQGGYTANCLDTQDGDQEKYWNADGIATERGNHDIRISDHRSSGHSDGGYDLKSENTTLIRCITKDNKRNYRIWGGTGSEPVLLEDCQSHTPRSRGGIGDAAHLWLSGADDAGSGAASAIFKGGALVDTNPGSAAVYADGNSIVVHFIDTDLFGLGDGASLVGGEGHHATVIVGSAADPDLSQIVTAGDVAAVEGFSSTVQLEADGEASWRLIDVPADAGYTILGADLTTAPAPVGSSTITVQARGSNGTAIRKDLRIDVAANPVGPGTALAVEFAGEDGAKTAQDRTGLNVIEFAGAAAIEGGAVRFSRGDDFITIPDSENFSFDGPFTIDTEFKLDNPQEEGGQDIVSHWGDASRQRGYLIRAEDDGMLVFVWTYDGTDQDMPSIDGPILEAGRYYKVRVDRDEAGTMRLYVDGQMVGSRAESGEPILNPALPLRISGRASGKYGANGQMRSLLINNGYALTGNDRGYWP